MSTIAVLKTKQDSKNVYNNTKKIINMLGGMKKFVKENDKVLIKPNIVSPIEESVTDFNIIRAVVDELKKCKAIPYIGENSGFEFSTEQTFRILKVNELADKLEVKLVNFEKSKELNKVKVPYLNYFEIPAEVLNSDVIINIPKMKMHNLTIITAAMKNIMGILNRENRRRMHMHDIDFSIIELNKIIKPNLTIVDALSIRSKAVFGKSYNLNVIIAGTNSVDIDKFCCKLMNINYKDVKYIRKASNMGSRSIKIIGDNIKPLPFSLEKPLFKRRIFSIFFWAMHSVDYIYSRFTKKSLIPLYNFFFGIRPVIVKSKFRGNESYIDICPVNAINPKKKNINYNKCMYVRCLKCFRNCNNGSIILKKGFRRVKC